MTAPAKMTPGPWSFALEADPHTARHVGYRIRHGEVVIAEAFIRPYQVAINEANARLLAAAPDMLAALKAVHAPYQTLTHEALEAGILMEYGPPKPAKGAALLQVRAAIAAAEGRP